MKAAWRSRAGDRHAPPVEMRFVDMFMAALGALIFMAMLMAFLLRYSHHQSVPPPPENIKNFTLQPFRLTTKTLPAARAAEPYEIAFAFQGGLPPAVWEISAGEIEIPAGLRFDAGAGTLSGAAQKAGTARFVVKAKDQSGAADSRPYELTVLPPAKGTRAIENWLAVVMDLAVLAFWLKATSSAYKTRRMITMLRAHQAAGHSGITMGGHEGTELVVNYDQGGIGTFEKMLVTQSKQARFLFGALLAITAWVIWKIWF